MSSQTYSYPSKQWGMLFLSVMIPIGILTPAHADHVGHTPVIRPNRPIIIAQTVQYGTINGDLVNVRSGPSLDNDILYTAQNGTRMEILGQYGDGTDSWIKVKAVSPQYPQSEGWVYRPYITFGTTATPSVNYYQKGYDDGFTDAQNAQTYDPVGGSRDLPAEDSREYSRGYGDGYEAGNPGNVNVETYFDRGYEDGYSDAQNAQTYDPVGGSRHLPSVASREYSRGYGEGYEAGRP